ncbi:MAG: diacylglycerol kinase family lipid kinase [Oscillospiraceae bacterium]|nr:diacylglycerol kinase family lipid kinase [Oscillospiraceae bacterium]
MKHIFIINPKSGKNDRTDFIRQQLEKTDFDWEIYNTSAPKDAIRFIREWCGKHSEEVRFYACGGDGTLSEVVNGAAGFANASVSCYPCGSGNDFVKNYGGAEKFLDIEKLCRAENKSIDLIKVNDDIYSVNIVNFGFDAYAVKTMNSVRRKPLIGGNNAYNTGIVAAILKAMKNKAEITVDGKLFFDEKFLLCTVANGQFIGGKYQCAPRASLDDGILDLCLVKPVSVPKFASLIGLYEKGLHLDSEKFRKYICYTRCKTVEIKAPEGFFISVDGEIYEGTDFRLEVVTKALKFGIPE